MASLHVLLSPEILACSPSQSDGVPASVERDHRFWGCEIIEEAGILLRLPQVVMVTAQTMLHRFYYRKSLRDFDAFRVAIGCLFLAAKVEEQPNKRMKDVLSVFYAIYRRRKWGKTKLSEKLLEIDSESYYLWRDWLVMVERQILIDLGFSLYNIMEHPHKYILYYIKVLDGSKELAQKAWGYLNDSLRIDLCVRYRAEVIASAAIFMAARTLQVKLPDDSQWFELFNVDQESLVAVVTEILALYKRPKIVWLDALTQVDPFAVNDKPDEMDTSVEKERGVPSTAYAVVDLDSRAQPEPVTSTPKTETTDRQQEREDRPVRGDDDCRDRHRRRSPERDHRRRSPPSNKRDHSRDRRSRHFRSQSRSHDRGSRSNHRSRRSRSRSASGDRSRRRSESRRR